MRAKSFILLMVALGCGLVASIGITQVMAKRAPEDAGAEGDAIPVFVALKDIGMNEPITPQNVKLENWRSEKVLPGVLGKWEDLENRRSKTNIVAGWPILDSQLMPKGATYAGASVNIGKGMRVVPVKVEPQNAGGGIIRPGDHVDVLVHVKAEAQRGIARTATVTVLQNVKVFAVNDVFDASAAEEKAMAAKTISLEVTPEDAQALTMATELGSIRLVMRHPEDDEKLKLSVQEPREMIGGNIIQTTETPETKPLVASSPEDAIDTLKGLFAQRNQKPKPVEVAQAPAAPVVSAPKPEEAKPEEQVEKFTIRILQGTQTSDMVLEAPKADGATEGAVGPRWRINASKSTSFDQDGNKASSAAPSAASGSTRTPISVDEQTAISILQKGKDTAPQGPAKVSK